MHGTIDDLSDPEVTMRHLAGRTIATIVSLILCHSLLLLAADLFVDSGQRLGNEASWGIALGDIDSDGDYDAVIANNLEPAFVWLNDGSGQFTDSGQRLSAGSTPVAQLADFDGDGHLDILFGLGDDPAVVWWNRGNGIFDEGPTLQAIRDCIALDVGDVTGDGIPDIVSGNNGANVVLRSNGNRTFTQLQRLGNTQSGGIELADMDGDGDLDIVDAGWMAPSYVWRNSGRGTFSRLFEFDTSGDIIHGVVAADLEGDGDADVFLAANRFEPGGSVWINDGTGDLTPAPYGLGGIFQNGIVSGDFNGDGHLDIAISSGNPQELDPSKIFLGDGAAFDQPPIEFSQGYSGKIATADLDLDGDLDLFVTYLAQSGAGPYRPRPNEVWLNTTND